ncbi:hypothetical protein HJFPF1_00494 [Paramyrothecium foliicola]|nr:hypothetical protein HJFPF1_00494 [Paramyrothecium foliicola]
MTPIVETAAAPRDTPSVTSPIADPDVVRGRRRDRSQTRVGMNSARADESSSTLRGRSRRRKALSPYGQPSAASTPALLSPTRQLLLHNRLRDTRREHCPSRRQTPTGQTVFHRRQRSRSRSRGPRVDMETYHTAEHSSSLRHEVLADDGDVAKVTKQSPTH